MTAKKLPTTIIYAGKDGLRYYDPRRPNIVFFSYPPNTVKDLEVLLGAKEILEGSITNFVTQNKIGPCQIVFLLSETICFERYFPDDSEYSRRIEAEKFLEAVPFESLAHRRFAQSKGFKVVACNRSFYETIKGPFEKLGFTTSAVIPAAVFGLKLTDDNFTPVIAKQMLRKLDSVRQYNFLTERSDEFPSFEEEKEKQKITKLRLFGLIALFFFFMLILIIMIIRVRAPGAHSKTGYLTGVLTSSITNI
jgi:hypothetical protein